MHIPTVHNLSTTIVTLEHSDSMILISSRLTLTTVSSYVSQSKRSWINKWFDLSFLERNYNMLSEFNKNRDIPITDTNTV
ncbi:hypothetical protein [Candidatus Hodgkinia cicadicola]|uniref:hypothetical protein n=1 Tax=Candidatus Hodgkinia cicadicola TaxID=573658 RepID=UPI0011BAA51D